MRKIFSKLAILLTLVAFMAGCATDPYTGEKKVSNAGKGAMIGTVVGAVAGAAVTKDHGKGALIGAGVGALSGAGVGYYMDRQEAKLRAKLQGSGVSVTRSGNNIILNMPSNITFQTNSSDIRSDFFDVLGSVVLVVKEFDKTTLNVAGHTDSVGSDQYNQSLSERRAASVGNYFVSQGVVAARVQTVGYGESRPVASNNNEAGRALNRRVELTLQPIVQN